MKLLFDATELSYMCENSGHKAGVYYVSLNLLKELQNKGLDIVFYCDFKRYYFMQYVQKKYFPNIILLKENSFFRKCFGKILYLFDNAPIKIKYLILILARFYDAYLYRVNNKNLEQLQDFDVYFSPYSPPSKEISVSNIKRFRMLHDVIPILENGYPKSPKDWYYKIYNTINENDYYVTNSECTRLDILKYFPFLNENHIKTTLLGANEYFKQTQAESPFKEKYIFSLCTLGKRKNLESVISAFYKFTEKNNINDIKLVLGGSIWNKYKSELDSKLNKYDKSKVILTGYINEDELSKYYSNALCFIYPSLYEGFGLPVLEAMQCGCPVITSNLSSLPEVIGDAGIQINPKSDEEIVAAFEKMCFDADFRKVCKQKGLERAKQFSWGKCASELLEFIKEKIV